MQDEPWKKGTIGTIKVGNDTARATLIHYSAADQESIEVVLLEDFICLEEGELTTVQRYQFTPE